MRRCWRWAVPVAGLVVLAPLALGQLVDPTRQPVPQPRTGPQRFEFEVIESFDARFLGDTPGHVGKSGGLEGARPNVALNDPVYRDGTRVGAITGLTWDRGRGSLQVEFDPEPFQRICVGDVVWISLTGPAPPAPAR